MTVKTYTEAMQNDSGRECIEQIMEDVQKAVLVDADNWEAGLEKLGDTLKVWFEYYYNIPESMRVEFLAVINEFLMQMQRLKLMAVCFEMPDEDATAMMVSITQEHALAHDGEIRH